MDAPIKILSTRQMPAEVVDTLARNAVVIDSISFIETYPVIDIEVQQEVEAALLLKATVIFTSMNAVNYVAEIAAGEQPGWEIYCVGETTESLIRQHFPSCVIAATASNAKELAEKVVVASPETPCYFFCGNIRRDELPDMLEDAGVMLTEVVVYETIKIKHNISENYNGILFFSPSAAESFFLDNKIPSSTVLFAIGSTTANVLREKTTNTIIESDSGGKENLLLQAVRYFKQVYN